MSDTEDTSTVAGTETPAQAPQPAAAPESVTAPQPAAAQQPQSTKHGGGWFHGSLRGGIIAAVVVVVAAAFFTIGWFTSTRGDHGNIRVMNGIYQKMGVRQPGVPQGGFYQRGMRQRQGYSNQGQGMIVPQQGQSQGQIVPIPQPQSNGQTNPQGQTTPPTQTNPQTPSIQQGYLGVGVETVTPALQQQLGLSRSSGVLVASVDSNGPALKAGIQRGDVIVSINGTAVAQQQDVVGLITNMKAGDLVSVVIDRNGQSMTFQVTLAERASISG